VLVKPTIGKMVWYTLSEQDADEINRRRLDAGAFTRKIGEETAHQPVLPGERGRTGHVLHAGNQVTEGDVCAATVVRVWGGMTVNLQVHLDGNDTYWATSRVEGDKPGTWEVPVIPREPGSRPPQY
jgi:hypothetical protein